MARYVATTPIYFGSALAFAAGAQVPEDHVQRFGYDTAGWVVQVADDFRGDAPELAAAQTVNNPPPPETDRWADTAEAAAVARAQLEFAGASQTARDIPVVRDAAEPKTDQPAETVEPEAATTSCAESAQATDSPPKPDEQPATGTTTSHPVTED